MLHNYCSFIDSWLFHPLSKPLFLLELEPIPADIGQRQGSPWEGRQFIPCVCSADPPPCPMGTSLVLDGCGFCKVCAKQLGEPCSLQEPCDHHKELYCDYTLLSDTETGICMAQEGQTCDLGGVIYHSGESFQPSCEHHCVCMNGEIGCVPMCASEVWLPSPARTPGFLLASLKSVGTKEQHDWSAQMSSRDNCLVQTTEWSECSATCAMAVSSRITNDNRHCQLERQTRICIVRPCNRQQEKKIKVSKGKKCVRTPKVQQGMHFKLSGCSSTKMYKPRFCGVCTDNRCCTPHTTVTAEVEFHCPEGEVFTKKMMFIKTCSCHHDCPQDNDIFLASNARRMIGDYDNDM
uniref:Cellular communication network factor 2b n=1 Tax=Cyclopterus lumpus TaxID=8103 RepID=A0A8C2YYF1_CYCLU